jgi:hypothetical protein
MTLSRRTRMMMIDDEKAIEEMTDDHTIDSSHEAE